MEQRTIGEIVRDHRPLAMAPATAVAAACAAMHQRRVGAALVVDDAGQLLGIFTGRDAVRCLAEGCDAAHTPLRQVMTSKPVTLAPQHHAIDALRLFEDGGFRHLPVCDGGKVCGIVSRFDFRAQEHARLDEETGYFERLR